MCENRVLWSPWCLSLSLLVVVLFFLVVGIGSQDQKVFNHRGLGQVLFRGELSTLTLPDEHGCVMSLETSDTLRFTCLAHSVDGVTYASLGLNGLEILVEGD